MLTHEEYRYATYNIRRSAFERLAALATKAPHHDNNNDADIDRLRKGCQRSKVQPSGLFDGVFKGHASVHSPPMDIRELDILLALCKAAPSVALPDHADKLVSQFIAYLPDIHSLLSSSSAFLYNIKPSPWEAVTYHLTIALLSLGSRHPSLRDAVFDTITDYLNNTLQITKSLLALQDHDYKDGGGADSATVAESASVTLSLVGFLEAASTYAGFWSHSERLDIIMQLRTVFSEKFLVVIEAVASTIRNSESSNPLLRDWRRYAKRYDTAGRPVGAMLLQQGLMQFIRSCTSPIGRDNRPIPEDSILDQYLAGNWIPRQDYNAEVPLVKHVIEIVVDQIQLLDDGSDYLQLGSPWQQRLAFSVKALSLVTFLNCVVLGEEAADSDLLLQWCEDTLATTNQTASDELAMVTLKSMVILSKLYPSHASQMIRTLLRFVAHNGKSGILVEVAARCLAEALRLLSQDTIIGTLYALGNVLSTSPNSEKANQHSEMPNDAMFYRSRVLMPHPQPSNSSLLSLTFNEEDASVTYRNVIHAIVTIAASSKDSKIVALAQSMLLQKIGKISVAVDASIIQETATLALDSAAAEFGLLLKFYSRLYRDAIGQNNSLILDAVDKARNHLSVNLDCRSQLYKSFMLYLLEGIVNKGDIADPDRSRHKDSDLSAEDIVPLLQPLALLLNRHKDSKQLLSCLNDQDLSSLLYDAWFNLAVHGITLSSPVGLKYYRELRILAIHSPPLVAENRAELLESDIELNTVLRRGINNHHHVSDKKKWLLAELPALESDIKRLSYPRSVFLNATLLIESLRATSGDCTKVLTYFLDPALRSGEMGNCMKAIADRVVAIYLDNSLSGRSLKFSASYISNQLAETFISCCHRIDKVQHVAAANASKIIAQCPSALCEKRSLFVLLDLLTIMWSSCLDEELDEFEWKSAFTSTKEVVQIDLSDDYGFRKRTLNNFHKLAQTWVSTVMNIAPLDIKGLLQTYLSDFEDDGAYGHISIGRSFALQIGSAIPSSDQRLGSIDTYGNPIVNLASDFVAQYTTRQEYRFSDTLINPKDGYDFPINGTFECGTTCQDHSRHVQDIEFALVELNSQLSNGAAAPLETSRKVLRRAAALVCNAEEEQPSIISHLVNIPFQMFTRESIKMGISLWLGIINEVPQVEPRILTEVVQAWERTIHRKLGIFDPNFKSVDPFLLRTEFAPSDKSIILKGQQKAQNMISPHFRVLQFLESHFNATRLRSLHTQKMFCRLISATLIGLHETKGHPLAREIHFHIILFAMKILQHCVVQSKAALWKLKDQILSAALDWFRHPPSWSFGGNRLQIKAEDKMLHDIEVILENTQWVVGASTSRKPLQGKLELLRILIENERSRLKVWLFPLEQEKRHYVSSTAASKAGGEAIAGLLRLAWAYSPSLAHQIAARFPSAKIKNDVRWLLINFPEKGISDPENLEILFGSSLPQDVSFQLKYLLYWAPVNPVAAVTYFLPAYGNHPFILQYAMRALESHSVDVSFFYIPQLVQALRYDALGYVERYILETAQLSQLFAHQVIWNMKANAFKDEDAQIPDPVKPVLDSFMDKLISSFSDEDLKFYEREFSFFDEVTDISGKLRPYIKRSKQEKKQKIEEELRKIKLEVGVYLPSNPDGIVIGIDRKSGKPLQSHAKAPFMATFRIRKTKEQDEDGNGGLSRVDKRKSLQGTDGESKSLTSATAYPELGNNSPTYEVWQSAIFKVGDDCRQDVLALQMIATFRSIFMSVGLDVFVYPYRVTATAPGCGLIDVLPNSISRDMLGREAVNGLYEYFVSKYGGEESTRFQEARSNFVKSMAAYSVISYLLQFKDRHNGNIMIDDAGHILHIDFGFCFDIAPGGVRFERAPFKLTSEMVAVMGGQNSQSGAGGSSSSTSGALLPGTGNHHPTNSQSYRWFESLVVKSFLASRPYSTKLAHIVTLMLDSGLPCFKPDTLKNFHDRFALDKSEREAADHMRELVRKSYMSMSTKGYDQFQLMTNNIPY
ncbi:hypothetical protein AJ80_08154 [Polytolypa hystricis UAMH7299]|uniref:1-phosphatidylinositol 4-kinase n=1 Tax=Polytolypa hystricis (strain UAMH7299) TaxID=1447883 RepID=A0A2B7XCB8_POLH7|nr:hypothetical protein AJ80_08154 [Polytolypa hystricis UAMH7299]